jgi:uncharacterized membrane protein
MSKPGRNVDRFNSRSLSVAEFRSGPLPTPEDYARYEVVLPGAAERILKLVEIQSAHRQKLELIVTKQNSRDSLLGILSGVFITLSFLGIGGLLVYYGFGWYGVTVATTSIAPLVGVFIYGTRSRRKERENKERQLME